MFLLNLSDSRHWLEIAVFLSIICILFTAAGRDFEALNDPGYKNIVSLFRKLNKDKHFETLLGPICTVSKRIDGNLANIKSALESFFCGRCVERSKPSSSTDSSRKYFSEAESIVVAHVASVASMEGCFVLRFRLY